MVKEIIPIEQLHEEIKYVGNIPSLEGMVTNYLKLFNIDIDSKLTPHIYEEIKTTFKNELHPPPPQTPEVGPRLANWITEKVFHSLKDIKTRERCLDLFEAGAKLYAEIMRVWAPIFTDFVYTVLDSCQNYGISLVYIISRDAIPFYPIALELKKREQWDVEIKLVELNRDMFGIPSVFATETEVSDQMWLGLSADDIKNTPTAVYLNQLFGLGTRIGYIETGYYGTLIKKISDLGLLSNMIVFYFSSCNPNIFGYCNNIVTCDNLRRRRVSYGSHEFTFILGDVVESIPKPYKRVQITAKDDKVEVFAERTTPFYAVCAMASYWALSKLSKEVELSAVNPLEEKSKLYDLYEKIKRGEVNAPYILPECIPGWKHAWRFLKEWDIGPLPPVDEMHGPGL